MCFAFHRRAAGVSARALRCLFVVWLAGGGSLAAAQGVASGTVSGTVTSLGGARLPHASLTLTDQATGRRFRGTSNDAGAYVLDRLAPGTYVLQAEFPGLVSRTISGVMVGAESGVELDVVLEPARVREVVTVSASMPRDSVEMTDVRESGARDVGELLSHSAGVWMVRKGGIANDVVLRALQSRDLNVLIDGARLQAACPSRMDPPAFHVDFSEVERVDIGKGPFDVRHQGSLGGVVNVVTRRPDQGWHTTLSIGTGSYGFANPSATASYGGSEASVLGGFSYRRSAPYRDGHGQPMTAVANYRADAVGSDAFHATTGWGRAAWRPAAGHQIEASYTQQRTDHLLYPYLMMDAIWDNADRASLEYRAPAPGWRVTGLEAQAYWSGVDHWMTDAYRVSSASAPRDYSMGTDATTFTAGGHVEATIGTATLGVEVSRRNWNADTLMAGMGAYAPQHSIPDVNIDSAGAYGEYTRVVGSRAVLDLGGRLDRVSTTADPTRANLALYTAYHGTSETSRSDVLPSGRAKLTVQVSPGLELAAGVGHTARVAEANERFFALRRMGADWVGNPSLDPARNTGVDVSLSLRRSRMTLTGNGYLYAIRDYVAVYAARRLAMVPGVMNPSARSYANVDARIRGFELSGSLTVRTPLSISGDLSYVRGTMTPRADLGLTSTDLAETPPLRARLRARLDDGLWFVELEGVASAAQHHVDATLGEMPTPSYGLANVSGGARWGQLAVTVGIANLFDAYYVEHLSYQRDPYRSGVRVAEPGRNAFANLSWTF